MSIRQEQIRSLAMTRQFLEELCFTPLNEVNKRDVREKAQRLLKHYPIIDLESMEVWLSKQ